MKGDQGSRRKTGRPLSFDRSAVLERAMLAFWRHGYETTSIADLTLAMGITAPSLYTAFGDKKQLFLEAMRLYAGDPEDIQRALDGAPTAFAAVAQMLRSAAAAYTADGAPRGCLLASATASGSPASADVRHEVAEIRRRISAMVRTRIDRDVASGALPPVTDAAGLTGLAMAVMQGMSVLARDGAQRASLLGIANSAMDAWPA